MPPEQTAADIAVLKEKVERLEITLERISAGIEGLAASKDAIEEIAEAWKSASMVLVFVKSLSKLVLAVSIIWGAWKFGFTGKGAE
mgnify:CR=1 FL=1